MPPPPISDHLSGGSRGAPPPPPPLLLEQTEARRAKKFFFGHCPPAPLISESGWPPLLLSQGLDPALHLSKTSELFPVKLLQLEPFVNDHIS